jgi:hypothetical protein
MRAARHFLQGNRMEISRDEARNALQEIDTARNLTRKAIAEGCSSHILVLWGVIWMVCYGLGQFVPAWSGKVWLIGAPIGAVASWLIGMQTRSIMKGPSDLKIGLAWLGTCIFALIWASLLLPVGIPQGLENPASSGALMTRKVSAYASTVPMYLYILGGLWLGSFLVRLGLLVTILTLIAYWFSGPWFDLSMAIAGGGALIASGIFIRRVWR